MENDERSFEQIMHDISSKLTGDSDQDVKYLMSIGKQYKDHRYSKEILRAIGRMLYDVMPENKKEELGKRLNNDLMGFDQTMEEVRFNIYKKDYQRAKVLIESLISKIEKGNLFENDEVSEYYSFDEFFEEQIFAVHHESKKAIRKATLPFSQMYLTYGNLLVELKEIKEAQTVLRKALRWNPVSAESLFEYGETFKIQGDLEQFRKITVDAFKYLFRPKYIARAYRNLGYYHIEKQNYSLAKGLFLLSLHFEEENSLAQSELYYIDQLSGGHLDPLTPDEFTNTIEKTGLFIGPDPTVVQLAYELGDYFDKNGQLDAAKYLYEIAVDLVPQEKVENRIKEIEAELRKNVS